ncbi:MAG TPA: c-type cytochrome domain-containing protein [Planctomycetota bacterium]|nr:c-type cytochrome domain-containing protein [Planctomycetota bacterium]
MRFPAAVMLALCTLIAGSSPAPAQDKKAANKPISFMKDVLPLFNNYCTSCHDGKMKKAGLDMTSYATAAKGGKGGKIWTAGNPAKSSIITQVSGDKPKMPPKSQPMTKDEIDLVTKWIMQGALNN